MKIKIASVMVEDQEQALKFYTEVLGFTKMADIPMGETYRWLTVVSPDGIEGVELALEPMAFPPARVFQKALFEAGIPATAFVTDALDAEVARLRERGLQFRGEIADMGPIRAIMFADGCGNLIHLVEPKV
ncbi:VOC family protein [Paucibacter sp. APW11]|uniref:VOC family protein n=1 Tax=Roseateles aquae TaxID=3077235 RepID=A0ABU3PJ76_9BURK|nr:VOC family protein [Paucibacter sp. APW11]MDT9002457.1 VOC family protein [Paucibacter sp. APW11]